MHPILLNIFGLKLYSYGFLIAAGFLLALWFMTYEAKRLNENPEKYIDLSFYILIAGIIGSRIVHVLFDDPAYYSKNPWDVIKIWQGGLTFYGGLITAIPLGIYLLKKYNLPLWKSTDILGAAIPIGMAFGRLGCFSAGCCYGKETTLPIGITFINPESLARLGIPLHPTQLYESFGDILIFGILFFLRKKKSFNGQIFWTFTLLYSILRFFVEFYRGDQRGYFFNNLLSTSQAIGIPLALLSVFMLYSLKKKATLS